MLSSHGVAQYKIQRQITTKKTPLYNRIINEHALVNVEFGGIMQLTLFFNHIFHPRTIALA